MIYSLLFCWLRALTQISFSGYSFLHLNTPYLLVLWGSNEILCLTGFLNHKALCASLLWIKNYYRSSSPILKYLQPRYYNGTLNFNISTMDVLSLTFKYVGISFTYKEIHGFSQLFLGLCSALADFYFVFFDRDVFVVQETFFFPLDFIMRKMATWV